MTLWIWYYAATAIREGTDGAQEVQTADRRYDDGENHYLLETTKLQAATYLNRRRTEKKDGSKQVWIAVNQSPGWAWDTPMRGWNNLTKPAPHIEKPSPCGAISARPIWPSSPWPDLPTSAWPGAIWDRPCHTSRRLWTTWRLAGRSVATSRLSRCTCPVIVSLRSTRTPEPRNSWRWPTTCCRSKRARLPTSNCDAHSWRTWPPIASLPELSSE